jgi:hypothetical protein
LAAAPPTPFVLLVRMATSILFAAAAHCVR